MKSLVRESRSPGGGWLQAIGMKDQSFDNTVIALGREFFAVEIDVNRPNVSGLHGDFALRLNHSLVGCNQSCLGRRLSVRGDRDPAFLGVVIAFQTNGEHSGNRRRALS